MKKREYKKPAIRQVNIHQQSVLMTSPVGNGVDVSRQDYGTATNEDWD